MNLFQQGDFKLHSGLSSFWKIEADALTEDDWNTIAKLVGLNFRFKAVEGVPRGGLLFAEALKPYCATRISIYPILIVDDVLTTGTSMEEQRAGRSNCMGVVLFSRKMEIPDWIYPIWQLNSCIKYNH